jgi:hypothetical protein
MAEKQQQKPKSLTKSITIVVIATALLLMIPLVAMQFTNEVDWGVEDFTIMGILLMGTGLAYVFTTRKVTSNKYRITIGAALLAILLFIWAELAVGIIGTPWAGS